MFRANPRQSFDLLLENLIDRGHLELAVDKHVSALDHLIKGLVTPNMPHGLCPIRAKQFNTLTELFLLFLGPAELDTSQYKFCLNRLFCLRLHFFYLF